MNMSKENNIGSTQPIKKEIGAKGDVSSDVAKTAPVKVKKPQKKNSEKTEKIQTKTGDSSKTTIRKKSSLQTKKVVVDTKKEQDQGAPKNDEPIVVEKKVYESKKYGNSSFSAIVKTVSYIGIVLFISVFLAFNIILGVNDIFAFSKSDNPVTVTIPEMPDITTVAEVLAEANVIKYQSLFELYARFKEMDGLNFASGEYTVAPNMNYDALIYAFVPDKKPREQVVITIPEGYSVDEIIDLFVSKGIGTRDGFIDVINNHEFDYWFLENLEYDDDRIYRLEGYLYPDTYYFWSDSSEVTAINKLLANFKKKFSKKWIARCEELGMTMDEVLILASIIQEEAKYTVDYGYVSSVFHNRLKSAEFDGLLQSDATIQYYYRNVYGSAKLPFTDEDRKFDCAYNTYMYKGLIPGPLSTPTIEAINSAMYPPETNYYYFVTDAEGYCMYAETYAGHLSNIEAIKNGATVNGGEEEE